MEEGNATTLEALLEFYSSEEFGDWSVNMLHQPPLNILLAEHLASSKSAMTQESFDFLLKTLQIVVEYGFGEIPEFVTTNLAFPNFSQPSEADFEIIGQCGLAFSELMEMDAYSMIKYEFEDQQCEAYESNEWPLGVLVEEDEEVNLSLISWDAVDLLYDALLITKRAKNSDESFMSELKLLRPRLLKVLELNRLATNVDLETEIVEGYCSSEFIRIRGAAAAHDACSMKALKELAQDAQPFVRLSVSKNPNTPFELLLSLALDPVSEIRSQVNVIRKVGFNSETPLPILEALAKDENHNIRGEVASNPATPVSLLYTLASDSAQFVRHKVLENSQVTEELKALVSLGETS